MTDIDFLGDVEAEIRVHRANGEVEIFSTSDIDEETELYVLLRKAELLKKCYML